MLLKSTYMLFNNSAGAVIDNSGPGRLGRIFGKKADPAEWKPPFEAYTSSTLNALRWDKYPEAFSFITQLVYKTDDPRNGIRINTFIGGPTNIRTLGTHIHNEDSKSPVSRGIGLDVAALKGLHENLGYEVLVHPGSCMTIYRVGFNVDWIIK